MRSVVRPTLSGVAVMIITLSSFAFADTTKSERQQIDRYERCASKCQVILDQQLFACFKDREEGKREVPENCKELAYAAKESCLEYCPVKPRALTDR